MDVSSYCLSYTSYETIKSGNPFKFLYKDRYIFKILANFAPFLQGKPADEVKGVDTSETLVDLKNKV